MPPDTLSAFLDHGTVALTLEQGLEEARTHLERLAAIGIDLRAEADEIQREGVEKFSKPFDALMKTSEQKLEQLATSLAK